ncbi:hypothetical protein [Devosia sp. Root413D1]|uniref:hypothetical protein n=1 Tax=Devosia sp. Root413D1 TaxID=1736531 RepID=UPI000AD27F48|nr:hypothetical protein [Devosia sp. Root413D1]
MSTSRMPRPSMDGASSSPARFFPDRERTYQALIAQARAQGRRVTFEYVSDFLLDAARSQLPRSQRRRFDRERSALAAEVRAEFEKGRAS